jgi:hypothetical protein
MPVNDYYLPIGQVYGTLEIKEWRGGNRYRAVCNKCGSEGVFPLPQIKNIQECFNRACRVGIATKPNKPAYDKPSQREPEKPEELPVGSLKEFREREAERERIASELRTEQEAERARAEQEAIAKLKQSAQDAIRQITANERKALQSLPDDQIYVSPNLTGASMTKADAERHNLENARAFVASTPGYYKSEANSQALQAYFKLNNIGIYDASMLAKAYERLRSVGLIEDAPAYQPEAAPAPFDYGIHLDDDDIVTAPVQAKPGRYDKVISGYDLTTGEPRLYSEHELDKLSASEYKFAVRPRLRIKDIFHHV